MHKLFSLLLAAIMLWGVFPAASALAEGEEGMVVLSLDSAMDVKPGDTVGLALALSGAEYRAHTLMLHLYYNADMLSVASVEKGALWLALPDEAMVTCDAETHAGEVAFGIVSPLEEFSGRDELFTVYFTVAEGCEEDQTVEVVVTEMYYSPLGGEAEEVPFSTQNGGIKMYVPDPYSGVCGRGVYWRFEPETGVLTVYGEGHMTNYAPFFLPPWEHLKDEITMVEVEFGVKDVGNLAFSGCPRLTYVALPDGMESIGYRAFADCGALSAARFEANPPAFCGGAAFWRCAEDFAVHYYSKYWQSWLVGRDHIWHGYTALAICTVTFADWDGTVISEQQTLQFQAAEEPQGYEFVREGYTFAGWDREFNCIPWDITVTAVYDINVYTVTFVDEAGAVIAEQQVEYGASAVLPVPETEGHHYEFYVDGVPFDGKEITHDVTVTAVEMINIYTVTFVAEDGSVMEEQAVEHGGEAVLPMLDSESHHYEFTADGEPFDGVNITGDVTVAVTVKINVYTVTFAAEDGTIIDVQAVEHGAAAEAPEAPYVEGWYFVGWAGDFACITGDTVVTAEYRCAQRNAARRRAPGRACHALRRREPRRHCVRCRPFNAVPHHAAGVMNNAKCGIIGDGKLTGTVISVSTSSSFGEREFALTMRTVTLSEQCGMRNLEVTAGTVTAGTVLLSIK